MWDSAQKKTQTNKQKCEEGVGKKPRSPLDCLCVLSAFVWVWSSFSWHSSPSAGKKMLQKPQSLLDNISYLTVGQPYLFFIHENLTFRQQYNFLEVIDSLEHYRIHIPSPGSLLGPENPALYPAQTSSAISPYFTLLLYILIYNSVYSRKFSIDRKPTRDIVKYMMGRFLDIT